MISPSERHSLVGPARLWEARRAFQIRFLQSIGLAPDQYLLDLGCGTLRGGIPIIKFLEPSHYYGIESREHVLREGKLELIDNNLVDRSPVLLHIDGLRSLKFERRFDIIWAFQVLIHMTDETLLEALCFVKHNLLPNGSFYASVNIGQKQDGSWQGFPLVWRSQNFYERVCLNEGLSLEVMGPLRDFGHVSGGATPEEQQMLCVRHIGIRNDKDRVSLTATRVGSSHGNLNKHAGSRAADIE